MKRPNRGSTPKQYAYAQRKLTGGGSSKKEIALLSGFSPATAENAKYKIESTEGYHNAMLELATTSNNVLGAILAEYQARGLKGFSNKDLNGAVNAISAAWDRIETRRTPARSKDPEQNPLRKAIIQRVENQTINLNTQTKTELPTREAEVKDDKDDDF